MTSQKGPKGLFWVFLAGFLHSHNNKYMNMDRAHFHYNNCLKAAGRRNIRHDALIPVTKTLCSHGQRSFQPNHNVTVNFNFNGVAAPSDKLMDAIITDTDNESPYYIDIHIIDPTAPTNRRTQHGDQIDSQTQSASCTAPGAHAKPKPKHQQKNRVYELVARK